MRKSWPALFAFVTSIAVAGPARAASVAGPPFEAVNVEDGDARAVTVLFHRAYAAASGHAVTAVAAPPEGGPVSPTAACQQVSCQLVVTGMLTRLGSRIVVSVSEVTPDGRVVHNAQATALSLDDLEGVVPRLAEALARHLSYEQTRGPESVTQREMQAPVKMRSTTVPALRAGVALVNVSGDLATSVEGAVDLRLERGRQFLNFGVGLMLSGSSGDDASYGGLFAELGGGMYFSDGDTAPYVAAALVPKIVGVETAGPDSLSDTSVGMGIGGRAGLMFLRSSSMRLLVEVGLEQEMIKMADTRPTLFRLSVGVAL